MIMRARTKNRIVKIIQITGLAIITFVTVFPIYWILILSLIPVTDFLNYRLDWIIPPRITFDYYMDVFLRTNYFLYYKNSLIVACITTVATIMVASLAGYSIGRINFKGKDVLSNMILFTYIMPSVLFIIPMFKLIVAFNLQNTLVSLMIAYMTFALPFCIWMLKGFFKSLPPNLEDAALIDGTGVFGAFWRVVLPLVLPGIVAAAMFTFLLCWNEYLFSMVFVTKEAARTLPVGLVTRYVSTHTQPPDWSRMMGASLIGAIPVYLLFIFLQKYLVQGMAAGAIKE